MIFMKNEIWFDVDDTLVDTASEIHRCLLSRLGQDKPIETWPSMMFTQFYDMKGYDVHQMRAWWQEDQILEQAQLFEGVFDMLHFLHETGARIGLITARAWHPEAKRITEEFIVRHGLPVQELKLLKFEESKLALLQDQASRIQGFIDDSPSHVKSIASLNVPAVLIRRPWNQQSDYPNVVEKTHAFPRCLGYEYAHQKSDSTSSKFSKNFKIQF